MNPERERDELLNEVLAEGRPADWGAQALAEVLRAAHRRQIVRRVSRVGALAGVAASAAVLLWLPPRRPSTASDGAARSAIVSTHPFAADHIVHTRAGSVPVVTAAAARLAIVETRPIPTGRIRLLRDDEVVRLTGAVGLVRVGPQEERLVFVPGRDQPL